MEISDWPAIFFFIFIGFMLGIVAVEGHDRFFGKSMDNEEIYYMVEDNIQFFISVKGDMMLSDFLVIMHNQKPRILNDINKNIDNVCNWWENNETVKKT